MSLRKFLQIVDNHVDKVDNFVRMAKNKEILCVGNFVEKNMDKLRLVYNNSFKKVMMLIVNKLNKHY